MLRLRGRQMSMTFFLLIAHCSLLIAHWFSTTRNVVPRPISLHFTKSLPSW